MPDLPFPLRSGDQHQALGVLPDASMTMNEREFYYAGLTTRPLLVASSASTPRALPTSWHDQPHLEKHLYPLESDHGLSQGWRTGLAKYVTDFLDTHVPSVTVVVPIRIGYSYAAARVVLWVGVEPGSTTVEQAFAAANHLQAELDKRNISADVEVFEGVVKTSAGLIDWRAGGFDERSLAWSTALGAPIYASETRDLSGSAGPWLWCGPPDKRELLQMTCKHVSHPKDLLSSFGPVSDASGPSILQGGRLREDKYQRELVGQTQTAEAGKNTLNGAIESGQITEEHPRRRMCVQLHDLYKDKLQRFADLRLLDDTLTGTVAAAPPLRPGYGSAPPGQLEQDRWTLDWTLIRPAKDTVSGLPYNHIPLDARELVYAYRPLQADRWDDICGSPSRTYPVLQPSQPCRTYPVLQPSQPYLDASGDFVTALPLSGATVDVQDLRKESRVLVKRGATTGLTTGVNNCIEARVVNRSGIGERWSLELVVVDAEPGKAFSAEGDSGAAVLDTAGNLVGLLTGGVGYRDCGYPAGHVYKSVPMRDLAFVTPIGALLHDIASFGIVDPQIAAAGVFP